LIFSYIYPIYYKTLGGRAEYEVFLHKLVVKNEYLRSFKLNSFIYCVKRPKVTSNFARFYVPLRSLKRVRFYSTSYFVLGKNKLVLFSFMNDISNKVHLLLSGKVLNNYIKIDNMTANHRGIVCPTINDNKEVSNSALIVTSTTLHHNQSNDVYNISKNNIHCDKFLHLNKSIDYNVKNFVSSKIVTVPINIKLSHYNIHNVCTSFVRLPSLKIDVINKIKEEGIILTSEHQKHISDRMEMINCQLNKDFILLSDIFGGETYKVNKNDVELIKGIGFVAQESRLVPLTLKENDTLNYNVATRSQLADLYIKKFTDKQMEEIIKNYKRHFN